MSDLRLLNSFIILCDFYYSEAVLPDLLDEWKDFDLITSVRGNLHRLLSSDRKVPPSVATRWWVKLSDFSRISRDLPKRLQASRRGSQRSLTQRNLWQQLSQPLKQKGIRLPLYECFHTKRVRESLGPFSLQLSKRNWKKIHTLIVPGFCIYTS